MCVVKRRAIVPLKASLVVRGTGCHITPVGEADPASVRLRLSGVEVCAYNMSKHTTQYSKTRQGRVTGRKRLRTIETLCDLVLSVDSETPRTAQSMAGVVKLTCAVLQGSTAKAIVSKVTSMLCTHCVQKVSRVGVVRDVEVAVINDLLQPIYAR